MPPKQKSYKWTYYIDAKLCMTCGSCEAECRDDAICVEDYAMFAIDSEKCNRCARCFNACPVSAVIRVPFEAAS